MWVLILMILNNAMIIKPVNSIAEGKIKVTLIIPERGRQQMRTEQGNFVKTDSLIDILFSKPPFDIVFIKWDKSKVRVRMKLNKKFIVSAQMYIKNKYGKFIPASSYFRFIPQSDILYFVVPYQKLKGGNIILKIRGGGGEINILKGE